MSTQVQFRRGSTSENNSFTGVEGEISIDTTIKTIRVHDGSTAGGFELAKTAGTTTNDSAAAGKIGEVISSTIAVGSAVALTSNTGANITSVSLTSGDWEVFGVIKFTGGATTTVTWIQGCVHTTSATFSDNDSSVAIHFGGATIVANINQSFPLAPIRVSIASTTTHYLVAKSTFGTSTLSAYGAIHARRIR